MRRHRWFEVTTPGGTSIRIKGDPEMDPKTLDALMALGDAVVAQFAQPALTPTEFRADGWPLCPVCGEDELWSPLAPGDPGWPNLDDKPPVAAYIAAGLRCYRCGWASEEVSK